MRQIPLVIAHRGASAAYPEHSRSAYEKALTDGADGLECDVRLSRDGHLVLIHDRTLDRTSDQRGPVSQRSLAQLRDVDFGGEPILTLDDLIELARGADRPVRLLVETKHPNRYGKAVELRLLALLRKHGLDRPREDAPVQVTVMSFSPLAVRRVRALAPALPRVQLMDLIPPGLKPSRLPFGARIAGPGLELVRRRPDLVRRLKAQGNDIYVWTVNELRDVDLVVSLGVDAIITDRPGEVRSYLGV
ncbi:glycerophosphodiester phosphodiesterase family protein [Hamadaea sp. NPDC051192]|uniref:glycerophosphodiester phosphodiesterase n=1 Tax=Hamadaea sp. NPDC051192 TaxID=3154940 RepID=UPI00341A574D